MIEDFLQRKLAGLLDSFIEFEKLKFNSVNGMTIHNSTIKPKLAELLSQNLQMPLELVSGSISELTLNRPWEKLFLFSNSPLGVCINGVRMRTKLRNSYSEAYLFKKKENLVERLTESLFNPLQATQESSSYVNQKLREHFLSTLLLEVTNFSLEIEIDLKNRVELIIKFDSLVFRKEDSKNGEGETIHLEIKGAGVYYKAVGDRQIELVSPTRIDFKRVKTQGGAHHRRIARKTVNIEKLHINVNNVNYGDIARVFLLIRWHNSFDNIPYNIWKYKPFILTEAKPFHKFLYAAKLVQANIAQQKKCNNFKERRKYLNLYNKFLAHTEEITAVDKEQLIKLEKQMPIWKIIAYRCFCINLMKKKIDDRKKKGFEPKPEENKTTQVVADMQQLPLESQSNDKKQKANLTDSLQFEKSTKSNSWWFKSWFATQKNAEELQAQFLAKVNTLQVIPSDIESILNCKIQTIRIKVSIITSNFGSEPFISLIGIHCEFNLSELLLERTWQRSFAFRKCKIEYEKYLGHHENYKNMLCESKTNIMQSRMQIEQEQEDEFQDINYFLEMSYRNDSKQVSFSLLPFDLHINHEVIEKITILLNLDRLSKLPRMERMEQACLLHYDPWLIIDRQKQYIIELKKSRDTERREKFESPKKNDPDFAFLPLSPSKSSPKKSHQEIENINEIERQIKFDSSLNLIIPLDMRAYPTTEVLVQVSKLQISRKGMQTKIGLKGIQIKARFPQKPKQSEEQQSLKNVYTIFVLPVDEVTIFRKFNVFINLQNHLEHDWHKITVSPLKIDIPSQQQMLALIQLAYLHIPKQKENRIKQYYRRKQSIGQEFMDACENLNEHITKSMIMSSDKMSKRSLIRGNKGKQILFFMEEIKIESKSFLFETGQFILSLNQIRFDKKDIQSHNLKKFKLTVNEFRQLLEDIKSLKLHIKKQSIKRGIQPQPEQAIKKIREINFQNTNLEVIVLLRQVGRTEPIVVKLSMRNIYIIEEQELNKREMNTTLKLTYQQQKHERNVRQVMSVPLIESCYVFYLQFQKYNLHQKHVTLSSFNVNIKPSIFRTLAAIMREYHLEEAARCSLTNGTTTPIKVKNSLNYNLQLKQGQKCTFNSYRCEMILFNSKLQLDFNNLAEKLPEHKVKSFPISQCSRLINRELSPNQYILESNIRILNHQDKTIWLKISQNSSVIAEDYACTRVQLDELALTPRRSFDVDLTQKIALNDRDWGRPGITRSTSRRMSEQPSLKSQKRNLNIALKPKEIVHILIDSDDHKYMQIFDQGVIFTEIRISELFKQTELLVKNEESSDENEYLVIRTEISQMEGVQGGIFIFHIYSPIYIVNKTPWTLQYRLSDDQLPFQGNQDRRLGRRRSFEVIPMKKIPSLSVEKARNKHYNEIQTMKLSLKKFEREIYNLGSLIAKIKEKKVKDSGQFYKESQLITFGNNHKEIQLVLSLQFSNNIIKIKIFPQYIFLNLTKLDIKFVIKEKQVSYPQILLHPLQIGQNKNESQQEIKNRLQKKAIVNEFINLTDEKLKQREVLRQLFDHYEDVLQIFTGTLQSNANRKMIYDSGQQAFSRSKAGQSQRNRNGYVSDYGSDNQNRDDLKHKPEKMLDQEHLMIYGPEEYLIFKRILNVEEYFKLVLVTPTVHIINKSTATFYAKSSCERLVKIGKESHNYILTNQSVIDLQGCLEEEDISLSEWIHVRLDCFGTIYYSKDMIQHHGSGYESKQYTLRKKRMKKTPKIFYKVLLCKYDKGQKIIIEESQYPPISFINNTKHQIRIEQSHEHFVEQLKQKGNMGEYAPKNPYHRPFFSLCVAKDYQYIKIKQFGVQQPKIYELDKGITLAVEEYKDKIIVNIKDKQAVNLTMSYIDRDERTEKNELLLEQVEKFTFEVDRVEIVVMNNWNKELNSTVLDKVSLIYQNKNYKDYYRLKVANVEGYDYMGTQPDYIFKRSKKQKISLGILQRQIVDNEDFFTVDLVANVHKNAVIIEKCDCKLVEVVFYISAQLVLAYVKNYYEPANFFNSVRQYYKSETSDTKKSPFMNKHFIIESLNWHGTSLKFNTRNLSIMESFLNRSYEKWIVKFINWLGDIKPISFNPLVLQYQQITLMRLRQQISIRSKLKEVGAILMDYPLSQLGEVLSTFYMREEKSFQQKLHTCYKIVKSLEYVVSFSLDINQNLKNEVKSYDEIFRQQNKNNPNIISKVIKYELCEWKYDSSPLLFKLIKKILRLERYNRRDTVLEYHEFKAKIKLALDCFLGNKIFRPIEEVHRLNKHFILSVVQDWIVVFNIKENEWTIFRVEHMLSCLQDGRDLVLNYFCETSESEQINGDRGGSIKQLRFRETQMQEQGLCRLKERIRQDLLTSYY